MSSYPMQSPQRVLVAGDWHGNAVWAATCCRLASRHDCEALLQLGDFGIWDPQRTEDFLDRIEEAAGEAGIIVFAIGGNHENYDLVDEIESGEADDDGFFVLRPHVRWIPRGHRWEWTGVRFGALGGAFSIDHRQRITGVSWWPLREEVRPSDLYRLGDGALDVLVTHDVPLGAEPKSDSLLAEDLRVQAAGSRVLLRAAVEATMPKLVLHGHCHLRNSRTLELPARIVHVEGLESDVEGGPKSWGVLGLSPLRFADGRNV